VNDDIAFDEPGRLFVTEDAELLDAGPSFELQGIEINPAQHGYTIVHNYALYFWRPYLGNTAFALWELLLSFCYGDCDTAYPSISRLSRMLTNSDHSRAVVTGRRRTGPAARSGARSKCHHPGALDVLRRERLVQVMRRGHGPTTRYTFRVLKWLPLLRPEQVARLSPSLQRDHATWLERYGIDAQSYRQAFRNEPSPSMNPGNDAGPTPPDPDLTPADGDNRGAAGDSTNNPQEKDPVNHWWQETLSELRRQLMPSMFETLLMGAEVRSFQSGVLTVRAPSEWARQTLQHRLSTVIQRLLFAISDARVQQVRFVTGQARDGERCEH